MGIPFCFCRVHFRNFEIFFSPTQVNSIIGNLRKSIIAILVYNLSKLGFTLDL